MDELNKIWESLELDSNNFTKAVLYKKYFSEAVFKEKDLIELFQKVSTDSMDAVRTNCRLFINGGINAHKTWEIWANPPAYELPFNTWVEEHFQDQKFGIVLNKAENYNEKLAQFVAEFIKPIGERFSAEQFRAEVVCFVGNYGYTPFGVHYDDFNMQVLHFHLGPNPKKIVIWEREKFAELSGSPDKNFYDNTRIKELEKYGKTFILEQGDLFLLPSNKYHIGCTENLSVAITVSLRKLSKKVVLKDVINRFENKLSATIKSDITHDTFHPEPEMTEICTPQIQREITNNDWMLNMKKEVALRQESNGYFGTPPLPNKPYNKDLTDKHIQIVKPFKLTLDINENGLDLFVRGRAIFLHHIEAIISLIKHLNRGESVKISSFLEDVKTDLNQEAALNLILKIYRFKGINIL